MKISMIIPTYRRPDSLRQCLAALGTQSRPADQVVIVIRQDDVLSRAAALEWQGPLPVELCEIDRPGVIQALNLGMAAVRGDIVVITDDDTEAPEKWLHKIEEHYLADAKLGGLGGRDYQPEYDGIDLPEDASIGLILPFGRVTGNHHLGTGTARRVDHLKGANMSWRTEAIKGLRFNTELRGPGAQVYFELAFGLQVANRGWKLVYDPSLFVRHYPAQRHDSDKRGQPALDAAANAAFNFYYSLRRFLKPAWKRWAALSWALLIGTRHEPGIVRGVISRLRGDAWGVALRRSSAQMWREAKREARRPA